MLKVGYLTPFYVLKNLPHYEAYLVSVPESGVLMLLPKKYAIKTYKIGEIGWAAVFTIEKSRITLSQQSPQYIRRILEYLLKPVEGLIIKRISRVNGGKFCKVAVDSPIESASEIFSICSKHLNGNLHNFITDKVCFVKYSRDIKQYIVNSLVPGPISAVREVIFIKTLKQANVYVDSQYVRVFMGPKGLNVAAAAKLTGVRINIQTM